MTGRRGGWLFGIHCYVPELQLIIQFIHPAWSLLPCAGMQLWPKQRHSRAGWAFVYVLNWQRIYIHTRQIESILLLHRGYIIALYGNQPTNQPLALHIIIITLPAWIARGEVLSTLPLLSIYYSIACWCNLSMYNLYYSLSLFLTLLSGFVIIITGILLLFFG